MADRDQIAFAEKEVGFAEIDPVVPELGGLEDDEQRIAVGLDLGPLVGAVGVFHRQIVQPEFLLDVAQQIFAGFVQADPDEGVVQCQYLPDGFNGDVTDLVAALVIGHAVHNGFHLSFSSGYRRVDLVGAGAL